MSDLLTIDGSHGEGGGQVIRTSVALAAMTGRPIEIHDVRGRRAKPGLQPQHLMAVRAAGELCGAQVKGDAVGSVYLRFEPTKKPEAGDFRFDIGTAGSTNLVVQTVLLPLALAAGESRVTVLGGTHNPMAPSAEYLEGVALPAFSRFGVQSSFAWPRAGFYPKGGGEVQIRIFGGEPLQGVELLNRGDASPMGSILTSLLPESVGIRGERALERFLPSPSRILRMDKPSLGAGAAAFVAVRGGDVYAGFTGLGAKGKPMERVSEEAGEAYRVWAATSATVDEHLADQLVLPACFAKGSSAWRTSEVTEHLRTMGWLVPQFLSVGIEIGEDGVVRVAP
ncbi:MAG: RNA 3'-terminal phosphate cyclase [Fimbriimonas sp.]